MKFFAESIAPLLRLLPRLIVRLPTLRNQSNVAKQDFNTLVRHAAALKFSGYFISDTFVLVQTAVVGCDLGRHTIFERSGFLSARHVGALNLHMRSLPDRTAVV